MVDIGGGVAGGCNIRAQPYTLNPLDISDPGCCHESHRFGTWGFCVKLTRIHTISKNTHMGHMGFI